jgi:hypothetical protein
MKASRAGIDVASAESAPWRAPSRPARSPERRRAGTRRRRGGSRAGIRFASGVVLIVALALAGFGAEGLVAASRAQSRVTALQAQLASLQQRVAADEHGAASESVHVRTIAARATGTDRSLTQSLARINWSLQSVPSEGQLSRIRGELDSYAGCVGQLESELAGLGIDWRIDPAKPSADYFKLVTSAPASGPCSGVSTAR